MWYPDVAEPQGAGAVPHLCRGVLHLLLGGVLHLLLGGLAPATSEGEMWGIPGRPSSGALYQLWEWEVGRYLALG